MWFIEIVPLSIRPFIRPMPDIDEELRPSPNGIFCNKTEIHDPKPWQMVFAPVLNRFRHSLNSEVPVSRSNLRFQTFPPEYLGTYAF
jgi:hypothetical protein